MVEICAYTLVNIGFFFAICVHFRSCELYDFDDELPLQQ